MSASASSAATRRPFLPAVFISVFFERHQTASNFHSRPSVHRRPYKLLQQNLGAMFREIYRKYIFPVQFGVCVAGNVLNLIVLSGRQMRTKTNCFLTAMAVADLLFYLVMLPEKFFGDGPWMRREYYLAHIPLTAFANWFSAASIWLTVAVTLDRLIATTPRRAPAMYRSWNKRRTILLITLIYVLAFVLSLYHFAWRRVNESSVNGTLKNGTLHDGGLNGTNSTASTSRSPYSWNTVAEHREPVAYWYVHSSHLLSGLLMVIGPLLILSILNCIIVARLRSHNRHISGSLFPGGGGGGGTGSDHGSNCGSVAERIRRREGRVTLTVVLLVSVFIVCSLPSGVFCVIEFLGSNYVKMIFIKPWFKELGEACNALVCTGKTVNFCLYCSASSDYRRELRNVLTGRRCGRRSSRQRAGGFGGGGGGDEWDRSSRSTSRVSSSCSAPRYRRSMAVNWQMSETSTNGITAIGRSSL